MPTLRPNFGFAPVIILLFLVIVGLGAYLLGTQVNIFQKPSSTLSPTPIPNPTANWKTYSNSKYGFQIHYPDSLFFKEGDDTNQPPFIFVGSLIEAKYANQSIHYPFIGMNIIKTDLSPKVWVDEKGTIYSFIGNGNAPKSINPSDYFYSGVQDKKEIQISAGSAVRFISEGTSYGLLHTIFQLKKGYLIDIYSHKSGVGEIDDNIYYQILSTFKFLEQSSSSKLVTVTLGVKAIESSYGISLEPTNNYPSTVKITVPEEFKNELNAYGYGSNNVTIGPKNWTGRATIGADGGTSVELYPIGGSLTAGSSLTINHTPACFACSLGSAASFFPKAKDAYYKNYPGPLTLIPNLKIVSLSDQLVSYSLPNTSDGMEVNGVAYIAKENGEYAAPFIQMEIKLPPEEHELARVILNTFINRQIPK